MTYLSAFVPPPLAQKKARADATAAGARESVNALVPVARGEPEILSATLRYGTQVGIPLSRTEQWSPFGQTSPRQGSCGVARARTAGSATAGANPEGGVAGFPNSPVAPTTAVAPGASVGAKAGAEIVNVPGPPDSTPFQTDWKLPVNEKVNRQRSSGTDSLLVTWNSPWKPPPCQVLVVLKVTLMPGLAVCVIGEDAPINDTLPAASRALTVKM